MKVAYRLGAAVVVAGFALGAGCQSGGSSQSAGASSRAEAGDRGGVSPSDTTPIAGSSATLYVRGMSCPNCAHNINMMLEKVEGVSSTDIDLASGRVRVGLAEAGPKPSPRQLAKAVENTGFTLARIEVP